MIVGIDCDDVCIKLIEHWLDIYNKDFEDHLQESDITDWAIGSFTKPECQNKMYNYVYDPSIYDNCEPVEDALWGVNLLRELGHHLVFNTVTSIKDSKFEWLKNHGFYQKGDDFIVTTSKDLIKLDWQIDDRFPHVVNRGKQGILYTKTHNKDIVWNPRANNWKEVIKIICPCLDLEVC